MRKKETTLTILPPDTVGLAQNEFDAARHYWAATKAASGMIALGMIFTGLELVRLHKLYGVQRGGDRSNGTKFPLLTWEDRVRQELNISREWAGKLMALAEVAKKRVKSLNAEDILNHPLLSLPTERLEEIEKATSQLIDERSGRELMMEFGIIKPPPRGGGGGTGGGAPIQNGVVTLAEEARKGIWEAQHAVGMLVSHERLDAWLRVLPVNAPLPHEPVESDHHYAALVPLADVLDELLDKTRAAIALHKKQGREKV